MGSRPAPEDTGTADTHTAARETSRSWAQQCRDARTELRSELADGRRTLREVLRDDAGDEFRGRVRVQWVLESLPGVRKIDVRRRLDALGIDASRDLAGLDPADIGALLGAMAGHDPGGSEAGGGDTGDDDTGGRDTAQRQER